MTIMILLLRFLHNYHDKKTNFCCYIYFCFWFNFCVFLFLSSFLFLFYFYFIFISIDVLVPMSCNRRCDVWESWYHIIIDRTYNSYNCKMFCIVILVVIINIITILSICPPFLLRSPLPFGLIFISSIFSIPNFVRLIKINWLNSTHLNHTKSNKSEKN